MTCSRNRTWLKTKQTLQEHKCSAPRLLFEAPCSSSTVNNQTSEKSSRGGQSCLQTQAGLRRVKKLNNTVCTSLVCIWRLRTPSKQTPLCTETDFVRNTEFLPAGYTVSWDRQRKKKKIWLISQTFASLGGGNLKTGMVLPLSLPTEHL